jgi:hypothetical protein
MHSGCCSNEVNEDEAGKYHSKWDPVPAFAHTLVPIVNFPFIFIIQFIADIRLSIVLIVISITIGSNIEGTVVVAWSNVSRMRKMTKRMSAILQIGMILKMRSGSNILSIHIDIIVLLVTIMTVNTIITFFIINRAPATAVAIISATAYITTRILFT